MNKSFDGFSNKIFCIVRRPFKCRQSIKIPFKQIRSTEDPPVYRMLLRVPSINKISSKGLQRVN